MPTHSILLPSKPRIVKEDDTLGVYEIDGLYPGYGHTLGNSLRRIILSSIPGAAITSLSIDGVKHEFSTIEGVREDVIAIILNLKKVHFRVHGDEIYQVTINVKGNKIVTAKDIEAPSQVEIANKDQYICEITGKDTELTVEMNVRRGLGYVPKEVIEKERTEIGSISLDAAFTPIRRASYEVENMRVGDRTDHNRLRIAIETNGTIAPREALEHSISTMITQLQAIVGFKELSIEPTVEAVSAENQETEDTSSSDFTKTKIEDTRLSTRTINALLGASIKTIGGLIRKSESDLDLVNGLGGKGIEEIKELLMANGLTLKEN